MPSPIQSLRHPFLLVVFLTTPFFFSTVPPASAQVSGHRLGIGGQIGDPSGVTLKTYQRRGFAYDFLAAWSLDDYFLLNAHAIYERPLENTTVNYYFGPGAFIIVADQDRRNRDESEVVLGISGNFGINLFIERFEVFLQITPRLSLTPETDGDVGGGLGLRYYL